MSVLGPRRMASWSGRFPLIAPGDRTKLFCFLLAWLSLLLVLFRRTALEQSSFALFYLPFSESTCTPEERFLTFPACSAFFSHTFHTSGLCCSLCLPDFSLCSLPPFFHGGMWKRRAPPVQMALLVARWGWLAGSPSLSHLPFWTLGYDDLPGSHTGCPPEFSGLPV